MPFLLWALCVIMSLLWGKGYFFYPCLSIRQYLVIFTEFVSGTNYQTIPIFCNMLHVNIIFCLRYFHMLGLVNKSCITNTCNILAQKGHVNTFLPLFFTGTSENWRPAVGLVLACYVKFIIPPYMSFCFHEMFVPVSPGTTK